MVAEFDSPTFKLQTRLLTDYDEVYDEQELFEYSQD